MKDIRCWSVHVRSRLPGLMNPSEHFIAFQMAYGTLRLTRAHCPLEVGSFRKSHYRREYYIMEKGRSSGNVVSSEPVRVILEGPRFLCMKVRRLALTLTLSRKPTNDNSNILLQNIISTTYGTMQSTNIRKEI